MSRYFYSNDANVKDVTECVKEIQDITSRKKFQEEKLKSKIVTVADPYPGPAPVSLQKLRKYQRGKKITANGIKTKFYKNELIRNDKKMRQSVEQAARTELLLPEDVGYLEADEEEDTFRIRQQEIASAVDITSATKFFSLSLNEFGPYKMNYSRDGRHLLLGGNLGHVAAMDWVTKKLLCEMNVTESVHDLCWLHMPTMFATAQKQWVYIYDTQGIELHCIKKLNRVLQMEFLPYHFLLTTASEKGFLSWLDISVGKMIAETYTKAGRLNVFCQNPYNAVVLTGHANGTVSMWSPNVNVPLTRILCHPHPITAVAVDTKGQYLATTSVDRNLKLWDLRTYRCLQSYRLGGTAGHLNFSQQGLLCVGIGNVVEVYKDCCTQSINSPYIRHKVSSNVVDAQFCPYEDVLGIGHHRGFTSILIPGSGEPNFDAFESNPFMTKTQRREMEVKSLLEKIQPELITLDPCHLGFVDVPSLKEKIEKKEKLLYVKTPKIVYEPQCKKVHRKTAKNFKRKKCLQEETKRRFLKEIVKNKKSFEKAEVHKVNDVLHRFASKIPND